jgi:hypothetical protein
MNRFAMCTLTVAFLAIAVSAFCQDDASGKLCVSGMQGAGGSTSSTRSRDELIKSLEKQKNLKGTTQALDASTPDDAATEAKQKGCGYVLNTALTEDHMESAYGPGVLMSTSIPTFFVTVGYKLVKVSDGSEVSSGSAKAQDTGSQQHAVEFSMNKIAGKVGGAVKGK